MKAVYEKPTVEQVNLTSEEAITSDQPGMEGGVWESGEVDLG